MNNINKLFLIFTFCLIELLQYSLALKGRCYLVPDNDSGVSGFVEFEQESETTPVSIKFKIYGVHKIHAFHIHEFGSLKEGCISTGGHYNPTNMTHGGPTDSIRHNGDLGNLSANKTAIIYEYTDNVITLFGDKSVYGRACVIHADEDDLGRGEGQSKINGNSGPRTACGILWPHNPAKSIIFGSIICLIGLVLLIYYFGCRKPNPYGTKVANEHEEKNY